MRIRVLKYCFFVKILWLYFSMCILWNLLKLFHTFRIMLVTIKEYFFQIAMVWLHSDALIIMLDLNCFYFHFQCQEKVTFIRASPFLGPWILMWRTLLLISSLLLCSQEITFLYILHQENQFPGRDQPHISIQGLFINKLVVPDSILFLCHLAEILYLTAHRGPETLHTHCFIWALQPPWWQDGKSHKNGMSYWGISYLQNVESNY